MKKKLDGDYTKTLCEHYADDLVFLANTTAQVESLLHSLEKAVGGIGLYVNSDVVCYREGRGGQFPYPPFIWINRH